MAIVNTNAQVDVGCIISVSTIVSYYSVIGNCAHLNDGAICKGGRAVDTYVKLLAGQVIKGN